MAELGNFTRAAERLRVAQPALSQHVRELETELALRLFDRTTRRVELTAGGREFRSAAAKILAELEHAVRNAHDLAEHKRGRITIAAPPLLAAVILPRAIAEFHARNSGVQIVLIEAQTNHIVDFVRDGQADCGLGTFPPAEDGIESLVLARDNLMLFCDHRSEFMRRDAVAWRDLHGQSLVTLTRESGIRLLVEMGYGAAETPLKVAYEVSQITTAIALVEASLGIAVLPTYACAATRDLAVAAKPLVSPTISRDIVLITASGRSSPPATPAFIKVLRKHTQTLMPAQTAGASGRAETVTAGRRARSISVSSQ